MKRLLCVLLVIAMAACFAACAQEAKALTAGDAQKLALKDAGLTAAQVSNLHSHVGSQDGTPVYSIHFYSGAVEYSYTIHAGTGEILDSGVTG